MLDYLIDEELACDWSMLDVCSFGYPVVDFTLMNMMDNNGAVQSRSELKSWIDCYGCEALLEFPKQPHFCDGGFATTLNMQLLNYYPECSQCLCVLAHPNQPHRCPAESRVTKENYDWIECELCACVLDYPSQEHSCPDANRSSEEVSTVRNEICVSIHRQRL